MDGLIALWNTLEVVGGSLSVAVVATSVVAIAALALAYFVAAIVVLARFAQAATNPWLIGLAGVGVSVLLAAVYVRSRVAQHAELSWSQWASHWQEPALVFAIASAVAMVLCFGLLAGRYGLGLFLPLLGLGAGGLVWLSGAPTASSAAGSFVLVAGGLLLLGLVPLALAGLVEMRRSAEWFIAMRYLLADRRQSVVSITTFICVGGVAAGVWLIVTVFSVMNGFETTWREQIVAHHAHFLVRSYFGPIEDYESILAAVRGTEGVQAASPYLEAEGMARVQGGAIVPVRLRGIEPESALQVTKLEEQLIDADLGALTEAEGSAAGGTGEAGEKTARPGLVLGTVLAEKLGAEPGGEVILIAPFGGAPTPVGPAPRLMRFRVVGRFKSSFMQYDELYAYASMGATQEFLGASDVAEGIAVRSTDLLRSRQVAARVSTRLGGPYFVQDWKELFPQLFHALNDNRSMILLLLGMIVVVSAFLIVVTLMMMIMAKSTDIGILKTMGASDTSIERIFAIEGTLIGISGVALGVVAGIAVTSQLSWIQARIEDLTGVDTLPMSIYQVTTLPAEVDPLQVLGVASLALLLSLGATLLPSRHGARLDPVEALRED